MNDSSQHGIFSRLRSRLFGDGDPVERQLREISRQGAGAARLAHLSALLLIVLFSAGSLVALGGDALASIVSEWHRGQVDVPSAISVLVSTLLVLAMDTAMIYAASMLRRLASRRADRVEKRLHQAVMATVALLEAATYAVMSQKYEHPVGLVVWMLILARAAAAPLLATYLSMARPIPVSTRDVLHQTELIAGAGLLRHVTVLANNPEASIGDLLLMYLAAGDMSESDRERLQHLIQVVQLGSGSGQARVSESGPSFPDGGGSPTQVKIAETDRETALAAPITPLRSGRKRPQPVRRYESPAAEKQMAYALLDAAGWDPEKDQPNMPKARFRAKLGVRNGRASDLWEEYAAEHRIRRRSDPLIAEGEFAQ